MEIMKQQFWNNSVEEWLFALGVAAGSYLAIRLALGFLMRRHWENYPGPISRMAWLILPVLKKIVRPLLILVSVLIAAQYLKLSPVTWSFLIKAAIIAAFIQSIAWANLAIELYTRRYIASRAASDPNIGTAIHIIAILVRFAVFSLLALVALDQIGVNVTALVAGLGVGGIAVALAVQNVLGDLLASLTIILDKPFVVGDFLIVDDLMGTVENVGLKTTRLRSLSGEQLVVPNSDLLGSRIRNFKRMQERRVVFKIRVPYGTPLDKLRGMSGMIREVIERQELTRFDRANLLAYGESSLEYEVVYYTKVPDFNFYAATQERINLEILERFEVEGIDFALPARAVYMNSLRQPHEERGENAERFVPPRP